MKPSQLSDRQKRLILAGDITDAALAERFGLSEREILRQRAKLREAEAEKAQEESEDA